MGCAGAAPGVVGLEHPQDSLDFPGGPPVNSVLVLDLFELCFADA